MKPLGSDTVDTWKQLFGAGNFQRSFFILLAIFSIFYFSELAQFSLSVDEEMALFRRDAAIWVVQDRWLNYLIERFILPAPILPFFPLFMFGALASLSYMIVVRAHQYRLEDRPVLLAFILFCAFPVLYFLLDFAVASVSIGIGLLLSCLCLFLFDRALHGSSAPDARRGGKIGLFALQAMLGAAAIGIYQSLILLVAAGCCGIFLLRYLRGPAMSPREILRAHAYLVGSIAASMALSFLISRGFQWLLGARPGYVGAFVQIDRLAENPLGVIKRFAKEYWAVYGGKRAVYGFRYVTFPALLFLGMFALTVRARERGAKAMLFIILYMIGLTAIPFAINSVTGGAVPYRTLIAVPYVFWFFAAGAVLSQIPAVRRIAIALVILVSIQCLYTFSTFQAQKRLVLDHDRMLASQIYERIAGQIPDFDRSKTYQVDFYGAHEFRSIYREIAGSTLSASFFEWDGGSPDRIAYFMKILGYSNIVAADGTARKTMLPIIQAMPVWPADGSVRVVDDIVLIRLGRKPGAIHREAMNAEEQP